VLVGGFGEALLGGLVSDGFSVGNDGVTLLEGALSVLFFEILKANFDVEFTATSDNVFTRLFSGANDERIGLREFTETFDELGQVRGVLDLNGDTHDRGHRELHDTDVVSSLVIGDGTLLSEILINTNKTDGVTARDIGDSFDLTSHHEHSTLNVLDVQVSLATGLVVGSHNTNFLTSGDGTRENTTESVEATTIISGDHLGDEDHEGTVLVAVLEGLTARIIDGTFIKVSSSVSLSLLGGRKLHNNHLNESLSSVDPLLAADLHEILKATFLLFVGKDDVEGVEHLPDLIELTVHDGTDEGNDGSHDELNEATFKGVIIVLVSELLGCGVEVVVTPELGHELSEVNLELFGVDTGEVS
jgi:hypothetical protein